MKAAMLFLLCSFYCQAETVFTVEQELKFPEDQEESGLKRKLIPQTNFFLNQSFKKAGLFVWMQLEPRTGYYETYWGPSFKYKLFNFGFGAGIEIEKQGDKEKLHPRFGSFLSFTRKKDSALFVFEDAGSGKWYQTIYTRQVHKFIGAGVRYRKDLGIGPRVEAGPVKWKIWFAPLVRKSSYLYPDGFKHQYNPILGFTYSF